jgi:hypothetical protein
MHHRASTMRTLRALLTLLCMFGPSAVAASNSSVAIDTGGNIWQTGRGPLTIVTPNAFQKTAIASVCGSQQHSPFDAPTPLPCGHAWITKYDSSGNLLYATYLGGSSDDGGIAITTDRQGYAYVTGYTYSIDFPVTSGAPQTINAGPSLPVTVLLSLGPFGPRGVLPGGDLSVARFAPDGSLVYSTLLGGTHSDVPVRIVVDDTGTAYISGTTSSSNFPLAGVAPNRIPASYFLAKLNPAGTALLYSTYSAPVQDFAIDSKATVYLAGWNNPSVSTSLPYLANAQLDNILLDDSGNAYAFGHGFPALPVTPVQALAQSCSSVGTSFVIQSAAAGKVMAATYLRQGSGNAALITGPGKFLAYRKNLNGTIALDLTGTPSMNFGCLSNLTSGVMGSGVAPAVVSANLCKRLAG